MMDDDKKNDDWFDDLTERPAKQSDDNKDLSDEIFYSQEDSFSNESNLQGEFINRESDFNSTTELGEDIPQKPISFNQTKGDSKFKYLFGAVFVGALISISYIIFSGDDKPEQVLNISQNTPLKQEPIDPKGMEIKNLDKEVFDVLDSSESEQKVERLLPIPEKPIIKKEQIDAVKSTLENKKTAKQEKYEITIEQPKAKVKPKPKKVVKKQPVKKVQKTTAKSTGWKVQLASVGSNAKAKSYYNKMSKKIPVVAKYRLHIEPITLNGKNHHRVQIVGFANKNEAKKTCHKIKDNGGDCFVKKQ